LSRATRWPEQVPAISLDIQEYGHLSIRLYAWSGDESDPRRDHSRVRRLKIIDTEEETDPAGELLANDRRLSLAVGAGEQNAGATSGGTDHDPPFRPTIIRQGRNVLHELELQDVHKELNGWFVLSHNQGDQFQVLADLLHRAPGLVASRSWRPDHCGRLRPMSETTRRTLSLLTACYVLLLMLVLVLVLGHRHPARAGSASTLRPASSKQ